MSKLYAPPPGFIDLPFIWGFDASALVGGRNYLNLGVYLEGGLGDFILRRIVGLDRVVSANTGKYVIKDRNDKPCQSSPVVVSGDGMEDLMIVPELDYPETGLIRFDLYGINLSTGPQIAFQGARRIRGQANPPGEINPKTFTYQMAVDFTSTSHVTSRVLVTDYPFVLEQLMIFQSFTAFPPVNITDVTPVCSLQIYDQNRVKISNIPILDIFLDGSPGGVFQNGGLVTPLYYRKDSQIQIDFTNLNTIFPALQGVIVYLIGKQIYPC